MKMRKSGRILNVNHDINSMHNSKNKLSFSLELTGTLETVNNPPDTQRTLNLSLRRRHDQKWYKAQQCCVKIESQMRAVTAFIKSHKTNGFPDCKTFIFRRSLF